MIMDILMQIIHNKMLTTAILSWAIAQVIKTIVFFAVNRKFDWSRLTGDGGMPSAHSATVTSLATMACIEYGADSGVFAVAAIMAVVVMHDAMGVRLESGKHAQAINELFDMLDPDVMLDVKLKEFIGHTPSQVVVGAILGLVVALCASRM